MISYKQAQALITEHARSFGLERVSLDAAVGRALGDSVMADRDYPPFDRATMDGYALRRSDLERGVVRFRVVGAVFAGMDMIAQGQPGSGECYKIMTGAAVPAGLDMVVRREDTRESPGEMTVIKTGAWKPFLHIARRGEDLMKGAVVIDRPCLVDAAVSGLLASLGVSRPLVARLPEVSLLTTGNEVVPVDGPVGRVQIRNSNRSLLEAALHRWMIRPVDRQHVADDPVSMREILKPMLERDIVICCGGVSAGDADHVPDVLKGLGVKRLFHKIAMKPGKPVWCGVTRSGGIIFALPGNPFSCMVGFVLLIEPFLRACFGLPERPALSLPLAAERKKRTPLDEFFPVRIEGTPACLKPVALNGSGDIRLGLQADALAVHPAELQDLALSDLVEYIPL